MRNSNSHNRALRFLYKNFIGKFLRRIVNRRWFSVIVGYYCESRISRIHINSFVRKERIGISEIEKSLLEFKTFNDFFIRKLKASSRPINLDESVLVSPADGTVIAIERISRFIDFPLKGSLLNLETLLGNNSFLDKYINGTLFLFRLSPRDYHRFHFPIDCVPSRPIKIPGIYESVNPLVYENKIMPLIKNERHIISAQTKNCKDILIIPIGALCVGKIIETYKTEELNRKGQEVGYFSFGGSSLVLVFESGVITLENKIKNNSHILLETPIKVGEPIAFINE